MLAKVIFFSLIFYGHLGLAQILFDNRGGSMSYKIPGSANDSAKPLAQINYSKADRYSSDQIAEAFYLVRDKNFLFDEREPTKKRRIPWFYIDDGCQVRADLAAALILEELSLKSYKVFIFGNAIRVESDLSLNKITDWGRFHVAVGLVNKAGDLVILDPSVDYDKPMPISDWTKKISSAIDDKIAVCSMYSFVPEDDCKQKSVSGSAMILVEDLLYLEKERLLKLDFDVNALLY